VRHQVEIRAFVSSPDPLPAHPGDTVVFVNHDPVPHTATSAKWDTGEIPANGSKTVVIPADGAGPYHCAFHPTMHGTIVDR
jgi:plastocyanin